jgi:peptide/nickel transport system permease protein
MSGEKRRRRAWALPLTLLGLALALPLLPLPDPDLTALDARLLSPGSPGHLLGTDPLGRDMLARLIFATRLSLVVGALGVAIAAAVGASLGVLAAYFGGRVDFIVMRSVDVVLSLPYLLLALAIVSVLGPGLVHAMVAIAIVNVPFFARSMRGVALSVVAEEYVTAARSLGASNLRTLARHILPALRTPLLSAAATSAGWMVVETAGLSFLGLGARPPTADLGTMVGQSRHLIATAPHAVLLPALALALLVVLLNLWSDSLSQSPQQTAADAEAVAPSGAPRTADPHSDALLSVRGLRVFAQGVELLRDVRLDVRAGRALGVAGPSGSGKSLTLLSILGLLPDDLRALGGEVRLSGAEIGLRAQAHPSAILGNRMGYVPQNPQSSLHPLFSIGRQITEAIERHQRLPRAAAEMRALSLLREVRVADPAARLRAYPHELSGGMRQRVALAIALANDPELLLLDEPTTALDVTTQASLLALLSERIEARGLAVVFVSHDLGVLAEICDDIAVMHEGTVVECAPAEQLFSAPKHAVTRDLLQGCVTATAQTAPRVVH